MIDLKTLEIQDISGYIYTQKELISLYFSYMHKYSKGRDSRRLMAKFSSDAEEFSNIYKKYFNSIETNYNSGELHIIKPYFITINPDIIIPNEKSEWKRISKTLYTYDDAHNIINNISDKFTKFLNKVLDYTSNDMIIELINSVISREQTYHNQINIIMEKLRVGINE